MIKLLAFLSLSAAAMATPNIPGLIDADDLEVVNPSPRLIPHRLAVLCTIASPEMLKGIDEEFGPHSQAYVRNYVTSDIYDQFPLKQDVRPKYRTGSAIIKEKLSWNKDKLESTGIGGMIMNDDPEYDETGGWQFFYLDGEDLATGKLASCVDCHSKAKTNDFVFGEYLNFLKINQENQTELTTPDAARPTS